MPLMKSKSQKAFSHNVGAEIDAGKPKSQALAIAYNIKRKKMNKGGMASDEMIQNIMKKMKGYSEGGMVDHDEPESMAEAPDYYDEDFLSDEEDDHAINLTYPDPDHKEDTEGTHTLLKKIMMRMNK